MAEAGNAYVNVVPRVEGDPSKVGDEIGKGLESGMKPSFMAGAVALGNILSDALMDVASAIGDQFSKAFWNSADFEQLSGGVEKIFDQADISGIMQDAQDAYINLNMSANQYLESINQVGAAFAQTMGDQAGYDTAKKGMQAIADYASGTGRNLDELNDKYAMITRSTSSYQSIADQFAGILPATSADFLEQAQAAGFLADSYSSLTEVPIDEYQQALTEMLEKGVDDMGLMGNTAAESANTISGSFAMLNSSWENFLTAIGEGGDQIDLSETTAHLVEAMGAVVSNSIAELGNIGTALATELPAIIGEQLASLPETLQAYITATFGEGAGEMAAPIIEQFSEMGAQLSEIFANIADIVTQAAGPIADVLMPAFDVASEAVSTAASTILDALSEVSAFLASDVAPVLASVIETVGNTVPWDSMGQVIKTVFSTVRSLAQAVWPVVSTVISTAVNIAGNAVNAASGVIKGAFNGLQAVVGVVKGIFDGVKNAITNPIETARNLIQSAMDKIKSIINGMHIKLPKIALPHFNVSGGSFPWGVGGQGSPPKFSVDWYARGGLVDEATLIGAGERGTELIWPSYDPYISKYAKAIADNMPASGVVVNFTYNGEGDATEAVRLLTRNMRQLQMTGAF